LPAAPDALALFEAVLALDAADLRAVVFLAGPFSG
jgi:cytochrome c-type biogenesis protein CcmH/NrfG